MVDIAPLVDADLDRRVLESMTDEQLATAVSRSEPAWPRGENFLLKQCLRIVLYEEWEHRLYAERDLKALPKLA